MTGRVIIVTGANSGIGFEAARKLCEAGNDVILACRSEEKGKAAVDKILHSNPNALATFLQLDVADFASIRRFVEEFHALGKKLHVLVNNAGVLYMNDGPRQFTKDNFELTMGTNYLGAFLLTHLLLDDLKNAGNESQDSRIIMVTSMLHDHNQSMNRRNSVGELDLENFFLEKEGTYSGRQAYKNSKVAMVMATYTLARNLEGSGVSMNCMCPGFIPHTELLKDSSAAKRFMIRYLLAPIFKLGNVTRTVEHGGKMIVDLSVNEKHKGVSGKYFSDFVAKDSSVESLDEEKQKELYELSARYCHLEGYEPLDAPVPPPPQEKNKSQKAKEMKSEENEAGPSGETGEQKPEQATQSKDVKEIFSCKRKIVTSHELLIPELILLEIYQKFGLTFMSRYIQQLMTNPTLILKVTELFKERLLNVCVDDCGANSMEGALSTDEIKFADEEEKTTDVIDTASKTTDQDMVSKDQETECTEKGQTENKMAPETNVAVEAVQ